MKILFPNYTFTLRKFYCLIFFSNIFFSVKAQTDTIQKDSLIPISQQYEKLNKDFILDGFKDASYAVSRPFHWKNTDWIRFSAIMGSTGALLIFDKKIKNVFQDNQNNFTSSVAKTVEPVGNISGLLVFPVVYATGLIIKNQRIESIGLRGSKAMAISTSIIFLGKNLIRRQRPDATENAYNYALPFSKNKYTSTPSAHASIAFTLATAFALEFPEKKWIAPVAYSIASATSLSRIYNNRHWASDVLIGAALGHFVTKAVYASCNKKRRMFKTFR